MQTLEALPKINIAGQWLSIFRNFDHRALKKAAFDFSHFDDCWHFEDGTINRTEKCLEAVYFGVRQACSQMQGSRGGIASHFDLAKQRYLEPCPGTTGCLIPTLLEIFKMYPRLDSETVAIQAGEWLLTRQQKDGAIRSNKGIDTPEVSEDLVVAFDCAAVLRGFLALFKHTSEEKFAEAAHRLASFLISRQKVDGSWDDICAFNYFGSHNTLVGYSLVLAGITLGEPSYKEAGLTCLNFIRPNLRDNGFIQRCHFSSNGPDNIAFLHPLAYTIEGYMKMWELTGDNYWYEIIQPAIQALHLKFELRKGVLLSHYDYGWHPQTNYSSVTSNAQIACIWFNTGRKQNDLLYISSALKMMDILRDILVTSPKTGTGAGITDSFPIYRGYKPFQCSNRGAKYFLDASLLELQFRSEIS